MPRRTVAFVAFAIVLAAVFVRLGFWQLHRRAERRAFNARVTSGLRAAPVPFDDAARIGDAARYRRVTLTGAPDYAHERVLGARTHGGSPGVYILTPVRVAGRDTAVLVNRGWVYSPDGASVELARWREADTMTFLGYADLYTEGEGSGTLRTPAGGAPILRRIDRAAAGAGLPYPLAPLVLVATEARAVSPDSGETPVRLAVPELDEGPHFMYALQWFAFAAIAIGGAAIVAVKSRTA